MATGKSQECEQKTADNLKSTGIVADRVLKYSLPMDRLNNGIIPDKIAYHAIKDELMCDGVANLNLATFCQTYIDDYATKLISETLEKNEIDKVEYPQTTEIEQRCLKIIANLWHHHDAQNDMIGTSTVGSSEACMMGGMAMKFRWLNQIKELEKNGIIKHDCERKPNLVLSTSYQVVWERFCRYWDIEMRCIPIDHEHYGINPEKVLDYVDENTIGVVGILGITYNGVYDDIKALNDIMEAYNKKYAGVRPDIGVHVDAASGGFVAPFIDKDLLWDFRLPRVFSISASGHKYGLVYPGLGWVLWAKKEYLPKELMFTVDYLGESMPVLGINFSKSASPMLAQYYQFTHLGFEGYKAIQQGTREVAMELARFLKSIDLFEVYNDGSELPLVCWKIKQDAPVKWTLYDFEHFILAKGWQIPAYQLPKNLEDITIARVVCRSDFSMYMLNLLKRDILLTIKTLNETYKEFPSVTYKKYHNC